MSRKPTGSRKNSRTSPAFSRSRTVWTALFFAMTTVGGLLWLLQGGARTHLDGIALPAAVASSSSTSIDAVFRTRAPLADGRWQAIVIHHSGTNFGTPASIEADHRAMKLEGLGFHFLVGNGSGMDEGDIHVGYRWLDQLPGAHTAGPRGDWYNRNSIGICVVGDGSRRAFSERQIARLSQLVGELSRRLNIPTDHVYLHSDLATADDPGRFFPEAAFREQLARLR